MNNDCWKQIGVVGEGDRSCPELKTYNHCHNCPVYSTRGRNLLEREAPAGYVDELTHLLTQKKEEQTVGTLSISIFRLQGEWLALPTQLFTQFTESSPVHRIPHRSNNILLGIVSIQGEILLCISLSKLLGLDATVLNQNINPIIYKRMVVVEVERNRWVFPVDEVYGIHRIHPDELGNVPATVSKATGTYTKAIINWQDKNVSFLDDELLFYTLNRIL